MRTTSRGLAPVRAAGLLLVTALALSGCGGSSPPALTTAPKTVTTTVTETATPSPSPTPTPTATPTDVKPSSDRAQVVKVEKFGISFELPKGWQTINAKNVLQGGAAQSPYLKDLAKRLGLTPQQLVKVLTTEVQTMSVSDQGAVQGFLDNVNSVGEHVSYNDDQLKLQLATVGARTMSVRHASSEAGGITRIRYDLPTKTGLTIRGVAIAVHSGGDTVIITVSSTSASHAARLADQIQASVKQYDGPSNGA